MVLIHVMVDDCKSGGFLQRLLSCTKTLVQATFSNMGNSAKNTFKATNEVIPLDLLVEIATGDYKGRLELPVIMKTDLGVLRTAGPGLVLGVCRFNWFAGQC
jgi:hypothetical protein